ncbi:MAG: fibrillarin-like rRNA/tRNA 2'-O-methyltransferase [Candidatus Bathyarchaeia archaeon]
MTEALFPGVYWLKDMKKLTTVNLSRGNSVYGEGLIRVGDVEYREWDPYRSKLAAAILKGLKELPVVCDSRVLYLGAATGTTVSHISDLVGRGGVVFAVEVSFRAMKELISRVTRNRMNVVPILADANFPSTYKHLVWGVDVVYCDVAQPNQTEIMLSNVDFYLGSGGYVMMAVKASSVDSTKPAREVCDLEVKKMKTKLDIVDRLDLEPYASAHEFVVGRLR